MVDTAQDTVILPQEMGVFILNGSAGMTGRITKVAKL
jgi:hypothetical protein